MPARHPSGKPFLFHVPPFQGREPGATEGNNTTKTRRIPGGLGLKLLRDFIRLNQGRIQIVSDAGYWEFAKGTATTRRFDKPFPGTTVNLEINAADHHSYCLPSEQDSA